MSNSQRVESLYKKHHSWLIACAVNLTQDQDQAEELVQDLYLRLLEMKNLEKLIYKGSDLNLFYLYKMIKSSFLNNTKSKKRLPTGELNEDLDEVLSEEYDIDEDENTENLIKLVDMTLNEIHWFDSRLMMTYVEEEHSIQSLHEATKISKSAIFNSLTKTKKTIKKKADEKNLRY